MAALIGLLACMSVTPVMAQPTPTPNGPQIRFFAPVNADGCQHCCSFSCRLTPTPTPEFDGLGRRVYTRNDATFILAVEATTGAGAEGSVLVSATSGGRTLQPITHGSGRPSLQLLVNPGTGNASPAKCDIFPPNPGGVPGINPPDFNPSTTVTDALVDMACRFDVLSSSIACTRNMFGDFSFLGSGSVRQYCYSVPGAAAFHVGNTVVAAQVRGTNGNLGPRQEIVIRVGAAPSASPSPTPTRTPTRTSTPSNNSASGRIRYYSADRSVGTANMQASGPAFNQTDTASNGTYAFASLPSGNWHIEPRKTTEFASAISSLDAARIFQSQVGFGTPLTSQQRLAADVTGNGTVSSLDGARIVQFRLGMFSRFQVSVTCMSDWAFLPMPAAAANQEIINPLMTTGTCRRGAIELEPIVGAATNQHFHGVVFGDVTGNWMPTAAPLTAVRGTQPTVQFGRLRRAGGRKLRLPVLVRHDDPFASFELQLAYDTSRLRALGVKRGRAAGRMFMRSRTDVPGLVNVAAAGPDLIPGRSGPLLYVEFHALNDVARAARVQMLGALVDDVPAVPGSGR